MSIETTSIRKLTRYLVVYVAVVAVIWFILSSSLNEILTSDVVRESLLYGFMILVGILSLPYTLSFWGNVTVRHHVIATVLGLVLAGFVLLALRSQTFVTDWTPTVKVILVSIILGYFETTFIYLLTITVLRAYFRPIFIIFITATIYAVYHIGYYGPIGDIETFILSFGVYIIVGMVNTAFLYVIRSPLVLFPFYIVTSTIFDLTRVNIGIIGSTEGTCSK